MDIYADSNQYRGYELLSSRHSGRQSTTNKTGTVQVVKPEGPYHYTVLAEYRFTLGRWKSRSNAYDKAMAYVDKLVSS